LWYLQFLQLYSLNISKKFFLHNKLSATGGIPAFGPMAPDGEVAFFSSRGLFAIASPL
jgi:hypothetical protein